MKNCWLTFIILLVFMISSCVEPISINPEQASGVMVVDGAITTEPGPYTVRISKSFSIGKFSNEKVTGARVVISDNKGNEAILSEVDSGVYKTLKNEIQGTVDNKYTLTITTAEGKVYHSLPEMLTATPAIDSIHYKLKEEINYIGNYAENIRTYFQMYVDVKDPAGVENYYRWESTRIMEFESDLPTYPPEIDPPPDPPECCYLCYLYNYEQNNIALASDLFADGQEMKNIPVTRVGNGFENIFSFRVRQYSLSARAYDFLNRLRDQQENVGGVFDTPPGSIRGNVFNVNDQSEQVLGYFMASAVARKTIVVPRFRYAVSGRIKFDYVGDCREVDGAVAEVPEEFENLDFEREGG